MKNIKNYLSFISENINNYPKDEWDLVKNYTDYIRNFGLSEIFMDGMNAKLPPKIVMENPELIESVLSNAIESVNVPDFEVTPNMFKNAIIWLIRLDDKSMCFSFISQLSKIKNIFSENYMKKLTSETRKNLFALMKIVMNYYKPTKPELKISKEEAIKNINDIHFE